MSMITQDSARRIVERLGAVNDAAAPAFDLIAHLKRQMEFSARTYGPGDRTAGVCDTIRKQYEGDSRGHAAERAAKAIRLDQP